MDGWMDGWMDEKFDQEITQLILLNWEIKNKLKKALEITCWILQWAYWSLCHID